MSIINSCRACLTSDGSLYTISDENMQEFYHHLTSIGLQDIDGKPQQLCYECLHNLKRCKSFRDKCIRADGVLRQVLNDDKTNQQSVLSIRTTYKLTSRLRSYTEIVTSILPLNPNVEVKVEPKIINDLRQSESVRPSQITTDVLKLDLNLKTEPDDAEVKHFDQNVNEDFVSDDCEDDDDNIPLNEISLKCKPEMNKDEDADKGNLHLYYKEIILSKDQQLQELKDRSQSSNYILSPYKCSHCFKGFVDQIAYANHMERHDKKSGEYICDVCKLRYEKPQQLKSHMFSAHIKKYECLKCLHRSLTAHQARDHERWHRGITYDCKLCGKSFNKPTTRLTHMRMSHGARVVCKVCGANFAARRGLTAHMARAHRRTNVQESGPESERYCGDCDVLFENKDAWKRHLLTSSKHAQAIENSTVCCVCHAAVPTKTEMSKHMRDHKMEIKEKTIAAFGSLIKRCDVDKIQCEHCEAKFVNRTRLKAHIKRVHLGQKYNKSLVCEVCGKKCTSNATLRYHQRTHTGERPYPCSECSKKFADSNQLRIHARTHSDERPYHCQLCTKRFRQKPSLNRHMRVHTGAKPYSCHYCAKTFTQSNSMKLHIRNVHLKQPTSKRVTKNQDADAGQTDTLKSS